MVGSMLRAVLFDLDDTLFDHAACARAALAAVHRRHECFAPVSLEDLERSHARLLEQLHERVMAGDLDLDAARQERFRLLFDTAGVNADDALAREAAAAYRDRYLRARQAVAGAQGLLAALQPRVRIAVVSNNLLAEQQDKLRYCGLDRHVDALIVSEEAGVSKPDPAIFHRALREVGSAPEEAIMIGDAWAADILGARAAGIPAIWFNPARRPCPDPSACVAELHGFEPVAPVVDLIFSRHSRSRAHRN